MKKNEHYFPTIEFLKVEGETGWVKRTFGEEGGMGAEVMDDGEGAGDFEV